MCVCVCVCVCAWVYNGYEQLHSQRERQEERKQSFNRAQYQTADRQLTAGRFWKREKSLPPSHFSSQRRLPKCPPSNTYTHTHTHVRTHTHKWHHNSISAINLSYEDASIFSNVNGEGFGGWRGWRTGVKQRVCDCRADLRAVWGNTACERVCVCVFNKDSKWIKSENGAVCICAYTSACLPACREVRCACVSVCVCVWDRDWWLSACIWQRK